MIDTAKKVGRALLPTLARAGIHAATAGLVSTEGLKDVAETLAQDLGGAAASKAEAAIAERLRQAKQGRDEMDAFREALKDLAERLSDKASQAADSQKPLIFIIDELDRCRPPFALNLLERIKHLFAVPGVTFVLVTNLEQLQAAVRGAYGSETNGRRYLEKFYDLRALLPRGHSQNERYGVIPRYIRHLWDDMGLPSEDTTDQLVQGQLKSLAAVHALPLRTVERVMSHVALSYAATSPTHRLAPLIAGLAVLRQADPTLYQKARAGKLTWVETQEFFKFDQWPEDQRDWSFMWWRYLTDPAMAPTEITDLEGFRATAGLKSRFDFVPWAAATIEELVTSLR